MNKRAPLLIACIIVSSLSFSQHKRSSTHSKSPKNNTNTNIHYGTASYYANKFEGRKTATGEIFSQKKMTAASNILSLNTYVQVTNLHNKKTAVVKITDRMHPKNKRLIDLSRAAAKKLGYTSRGLTRVKVEVLGKKAPDEWKMEAVAE
ncbi:MAG: septal ring lytic transglycosylase RlpA family protein [Bacteroidetes bacterium]|nr:septal ring lytic transglycosylase RlpA family protein [Bacteroidota bacterium]